MAKFSAALALSVLTLSLSLPACAASIHDDNAVTSKPSSATNQDRRATQAQKNASHNGDTKAVLGHTWDDRTEETAKMPGTTGPRKTPKGGAGLSYPATE